MGNILNSKSQESIWTTDNNSLCMSILDEDLSYINDASVRNSYVIKTKMYICNSSNLYQHWKFTTLSSNYSASKTTTTTKKTTTTTKKTTTTTKKTTTTTKISSTQNVYYTPLTMGEYDQELTNPYRGWFHGAVTIDLNDYPELDCNFINRFHQVQKYDKGLQYLGVRLAEFRDRKISEKALAALDNLLNEYKKRQETIDPTTQVILRFYYDGENNCKTKSDSFDPIISGIDEDEKNDSDTEGKFSQVDDGHLHVSYEDFQYIQQIYNPNILNESPISEEEEETAEVMQVEDEETEPTEDIEYIVENKQEIGYINDENDLVLFNNAEQIQLDEESQKKLEYKERYLNERYYNKYHELNLKREELEDYVKNSVFINDKLNKTRLIENNRISNRASIRDDFIIKNATVSDLSKSNLSVAKELKKISYYQCTEKSPSDSSKCIKQKVVNTYCIYQFKPSTGCQLYTTYEIEPDDINVIFTHIVQLASIVNKYKNLIYIYQGSFVGTFGEMHHSNYLDLNSLTQIMKTIERNFDPSIFLSVRTPRFNRGVKNNMKTSSRYSSFVSRAGLYNDGLFYSETDYGTYGNTDININNGDVNAYRSQEVQYQNELCLTVPNGGEGVFNANVVDSYTNVSDLNTVNSILKSPKTYINFYVSEAHARNIHLTYLNYEYDQRLFNHWAKTTAKYVNKPNWNLNGKEYIANNLGYRYVIRSSKLLSTNVLNIVVENVGFAPAYVSFNTKVILRSTSPSQEIELNIQSDNRKWGFIKQGNTYVKTVTLSVDLSQQYSKLKGKSYTIFFNVHDPRTGVDIKFGNYNTYYDNLGYRVGILNLA
ncbi:hypothetical protein BCR36DRAFT_579282 [Piromyces finnis]|uniref:Uncharacterized protein n=1 Tax=Piromyces finnis TaxID=1754191 RepID=A0A1Y1VQY2_9FUNG|nr:hypothetical protein BCR36DRAFT_579282 [Piromyces finnis]|eukprot:ORX61261.1 hypothetical protein BCR36DRAFT_579282 [Piromyces finnis]